MSSDQNHLSRAQADLQARLTEVLPETWFVVDADTQGDNPIRRTTVAVAQGDIVSEVAGTGLPRGFVGVEFDLLLIVPEGPGPKGVARVSDAAFDFLTALDPMDDLTWSTGTRLTLSPGGETAYRFSITFLTHFITPAPEEE